MSGASGEPYLLWFGVGICLVLISVALLAVTGGGGRPRGPGPPAPASQQEGETPAGPANRTNCGEIAGSDLRSPGEGLWFEGNCVLISEPPLAAYVTDCNRTSLDPGEFTAVAPGLYVTRQTPGSTGFLWYASADNCFDLVSTRVVSAVCADQTVTFNRSASVCAAHGGVVASVNGR